MSLIISRFLLKYGILETPVQDHIALEDYEIHDGMNLELYYQ